MIEYNNTNKINVSIEGVLSTERNYKNHYSNLYKPFFKVQLALIEFGWQTRQYFPTCA